MVEFGVATLHDSLYGITEPIFPISPFPETT